MIIWFLTLPLKDDQCLNIPHWLSISLTVNLISCQWGSCSRVVYKLQVQAHKYF